MATTELIPRIDPEGIQKATGDLADLRVTLSAYEADAKTLVVTNPQEYAYAGELLKKVRDNRKQGAWVMQPLKAIAKTIADKFRTMELEHLNKCEQIESIIEPKMVAQKQREREAAQAEERRINEEAHRRAQEQAEEDRKAREKAIAASQKAGEIGKREAAKQVKAAEEDAKLAAAAVQEVKVEPNTPKIAGLRQRVVWKYRITEVDLIPREYMMPNEVKIGQAVRDKKTEGHIIPGIVAYYEDAI